MTKLSAGPNQAPENYEEKFHRINASIPCGVYEYYLALDGESHFIYFNDRLLEILQIEREELGRDARLIWKYIHPDDVERLAAEDLRTRETGEKFFIELRVIASNGLERWLQVSSQQTNMMIDGVYTRSGYILDITEMKQQEAKLSALSMTIPDLILIIDEDGRYIETNQSKYLELFFPKSLNIIGKTFNDIFPAEIAQPFYTFLQQVLSSDGSISMEYPLTALDGTVYHFESRCVVMRDLINGKRATTWVIRDITKRKAAEKLAIDRGIELSLAKQQLEILQEKEKENQILRNAMATREFQLYYQPKVDIQLGRVIRMEALIRWKHPDKGLLLPDSFMHLFKENSLSIEFSEWIIRSVLDQMETWRLQGLLISASANIDGLTLEQEDFVPRLKQILLQYPQLPPGSLHLELLETTALSDLPRISEVMKACHEIGVGFALDDFGTGYSSLAYLKSLPVDALKIDQMFVIKILENSQDYALVESVISLAKKLGRTVIAEGVETKAHGELLLKMGCHIFQGYGIAKPMPASAVKKWIADWEANPIWLD